MDRNTIIAVILSVIVITAGMTIQAVLFPPEMPPAAASEEEMPSESTAPLPVQSGSEITAEGSVEDASPFEIAAGSYVIVFDPMGGDISSIRLSEHLDNGSPVELVFRDPDDADLFTLYAGGDRNAPIDDAFSHSIENREDFTIVAFSRDFVSADGNPFTIEKRYAIPLNGEYMIQLQVNISTPDGSPVPLNDGSIMYSVSVGPQIGPSFSSVSNSYDYRRVSVRYDGRSMKNAGFDDGVFVSDSDETVDWMALAGKYFAFIFIPETDGIIASAYAEQSESSTEVPQKDVIYLNRTASGSSSVSDMYSFYAGPKVKSNLDIYDTRSSNAFNIERHDLTDIIEGSWLSWLESILNWILQTFHKVIPNYGVAIILLTILIKLLLQPLTKKGMDSTAKMGALAPKINEIKERYPNDPEAQNAAMAKLYKEEGINPMGSCIPMLIQFPIFIALYGLLNTNFDLRGSMFIPGWIPDLSIPDTIFTLPFGIPLLGSQVHLLPILYTFSMIFSMKITQSGSQAGQQQSMIAFMTYGMPIIFFFIMYNAPSGLLLYWTTVNLISIGQQLFVNRRKKAAYAEEIAEHDAARKARKEAKRKSRRK